MLNRFLSIFCFYAIALSNATATTDKINYVEYSIKFLGEAIDNLRNDAGRYPNSSEGLQALLVKPSAIANWRGPYLKRLSVPKDSWFSEYIYIYPARYGSKEYDLYSIGPNKIDEQGKGDDITNWRK